MKVVRKMKRTKKMLSIFLSLVLALAMVPSIAFADEGQEAVEGQSAQETVVQDDAATPEAPEAAEPEAPEAAEPEAAEPEAVEPQAEEAVPAEPADEPAAPEQEAAPAPAAKAAAQQTPKSANANARSTYDLSGFQVTVNDGMVYTGGYLKPAVTIVDPDGIKLVKGTDYTLSYANNKAKGKATITIKMKGDYTGSAKVTFVIGSWKKYSGGYRFGYQKGNVFYCFQKQFATINGKTYRLNASGFRLTGWQNISGARYRFNANGVMQKGLITVSGSKYYMNPTNGKLRTGWWTVNGKLRYFRSATSPKGKMYSVTKSGQVTINGYKYYYINNGSNDYAVKNAWYGGLYYGSNGRYTIVKPSVYAEFDSEYVNYYTNAVGFYLENNSKGGILTIQESGHKMDTGESLVLASIVDGRFEDLSWQRFPAGSADYVCLRTSDYGQFDFLDTSTIMFKFKYDGVMWNGYVDANGFSCVRA